MNRTVWIVVLIGGTVALMATIRKGARRLVAEQVTDGILDKLGPNPPPNAVKAAQEAGKCFAARLGLVDVAALAAR